MRTKVLDTEVVQERRTSQRQRFVPIRLTNEFFSDNEVND